MRIQFNSTTEKHAIASFVDHCKSKGISTKRMAISTVCKRTGCYVVYTR